MPDAPVKVAQVATIPVSLTALLGDQMQWLRNRGFDVATVSSPGREVAALNAAGFTHHAVPISRRITPIADAIALLRLVRIFRRERFDIVHTHTPKAGLLGQLAARITRVPIVINTLHCLNLEYDGRRVTRALIQMTEKVAASASDLILFMNDESLDFFLSHGLAPREKCVSIGNGIDLSRFDPALVTDDAVAAARRLLRVSPDQRVVGFVGRLAARRKGVSALIEAGLRAIERYPDVVFAVIGEPEADGADAVPSELIERATATGRFRFTGGVANTELPALYSAMTALVLPSLVEGRPRVVMESAAMGLPAIVTDVQGNREVVVDGITGRVVPYGSLDALAGAIEEMLERPDALRIMAGNARAHAVQQFDQTAMFEKIHQCYRQLLAARGMA